MIKILITGENSYVGKSLEKWLAKSPDEYKIYSISLKNYNWKEQDFSFYDVVFHVAGIVHVKETNKNVDLYYKVNQELTFEIASKSKKDGVSQFIFLSSMSIYGISTGIIRQDTPEKPKTNYGKSKLKAEKLIETLNDDKFKIAIIRPPMIYGKGCKGNYQKLANFSLKAPLFPNFENKRSMIYIDNFCEFVRLIIENASSGLFFPQNEEYVCTSEMVKMIAEVHGKKIWMTKLFNFLLGVSKIALMNKIFGDLVYEKTMSTYKNNYFIKNFKESIYLAEG